MTILPHHQPYRIHILCFLLLALFIGATPHVLATDDGVTLPVLSAEGFLPGENGWETISPIYQVNASSAFVMDAEQSSSIIRGATGFQELKENGGTAYLDEPKPLAFELDVPHDGSYMLYVRLRKNMKTFRGQGVVLNLDRGERRSPEFLDVRLDGKKQAATALQDIGAEWGWVECKAISLTGGMHTLNLSELNGYQLDRIVLKPKAAANGDSDAPNMLDEEEEEEIDDGEALDALESLTGTHPLDELKPSTRRIVNTATVCVAEIAPLSVRAWNALVIDSTGTPPVAEVSTDDGKSWTSVRGTLADIKPVGGGADRLRVRLRWTPAPDAPPVFRSVRATWTADASDSVRISGPRLSMEFNKTSGRLHELRDASTDTRIALPLARDLFALTLVKNETPAQLSASMFRFLGVKEHKENGVVTHAFSFEHETEKITAICRITPPSGDGASWRLDTDIQNKGTATVLDVSAIDAAGLLGVEKCVIPESLWGRGSGTYLFPGELSMGWVFLYGEERGLYFASLDTTLADVHLSAITKGPLAKLGAKHHAAVAPGTSRTFSYALAAGKPDWHWAADRYGAWARAWMKRPVWTDTTRHLDGWWTQGSDTSACLLDRRSTTIFEEARWMGLPYLQIWIGCGDGEFVGRMPHLSPRLGTPEMSKKDSERIRKLGGRIGHYIQSREWRIDFATADKIGYVPRKYFPKDLVIEPEEWSKKNMLSGGHECQIMCPASDEWRAHIVRHAQERITRFGNDTAYFDQLGCTAMRCKQGNKHGHGQEQYITGRGYTTMAQELSAAMVSLNSAATLAQEGMNCATGQYVNFHLISSRPYRDHGKQFLYTFPEAALVRGYSNGVFTWAQDELRPFMRDLYLFHRFEIPGFDLYARDLVLLRQRIHDWQYDGRFMDDVGLTLHAPDGVDVRSGKTIRAKWFVYNKDGTQGILINWHNRQPREGIALELARAHIPFKPSGRAFAYFDDGSVEPADIQISDTSVRLPLPARAVGSLLIPGTVAPKDALRAFAWQHTWTGPDRLRLGAVNISDTPLDATWTLDLPEGFVAEASTGTLTIPAGKASHVDVPLQTLAPAMGEATVRWQAGNHTLATRAIVSPPLRNGGFELDEDSNAHPDSWWNFSKEIAHILHRLVAEEDLFAFTAKRDETVKRSGNASLRLEGKRTYTIDTESTWGAAVGTKSTFTYSASQHLWLKPYTRYRVTAYAYANNDNAACSLTVLDATHNIQRLRKNEWTKLTLGFDTGKTVVAPSVTLKNNSGAGIAVWFDDVLLEELGSVK